MQQIVARFRDIEAKTILIVARFSTIIIYYCNDFRFYSRAINSGAMALAPDMPYSGASKYVGIPRAVVQKLTQYPLEGVGQTAKVGDISEFPVLYACGTEDTSDLCEKKFGNETCAKIADCTYLQLPGCGHDVVGCTVTGSSLMDAIVANIKKASSLP